MREDFKIAAIILIIFGVTVGFIIIAGDTIGLTDTDAETLISILPGIGIMLVAFWGVSQSTGYMLSASVAGIGFGLVYLIHLMNEAALLIPDLEMSATDLQLVILVVFLIIAAGLAVREY